MFGYFPRRLATLTPVAAALLAAFSLTAIAQTRLPEVRVEGQLDTPLNNDARSDSGSLLGLTPRQTPATVELIDRATLESRGLRSVTEAAQGAVGVTAGDPPGEPAGFSMRGFTHSQINTLYNGIKIGPQNMTSRVMDTGFNSFFTGSSGMLILSLKAKTDETTGGGFHGMLFFP